jgi:hypothetical protein
MNTILVISLVGIIFLIFLAKLIHWYFFDDFGYKSPIYIYKKINVGNPTIYLLKFKKGVPRTESNLSLGMVRAKMIPAQSPEMTMLRHLRKKTLPLGLGVSSRIYGQNVVSIYFGRNPDYHQGPHVTNELPMLDDHTYAAINSFSYELGSL